MKPTCPVHPSLGHMHPHVVHRADGATVTTWHCRLRDCDRTEQWVQPALFGGDAA